MLSAPGEALRLIELTSARLYGGIASRRGGADGALLHAAWGPDDRPLSSEQLQALARDLPNGVTLDQSSLAEPRAFSPHLGRIVLNLLLLAAGSLPLGGVITLMGSPDDLFLRIAGPGAAWPARMAGCVVDAATAAAILTELMPSGGTASEMSGVQMPLTALLAHACQAVIRARRIEPRRGADAAPRRPLIINRRPFTFCLQTPAKTVLPPV